MNEIIITVWEKPNCVQCMMTKREFDKRSHIEKYIPHIGIALQEILGLSNTEKDETVEILEGTLHRSRKF